MASGRTYSSIHLRNGMPCLRSRPARRGILISRSITVNALGNRAGTACGVTPYIGSAAGRPKDIGTTLRSERLGRSGWRVHARGLPASAPISIWVQLASGRQVPGRPSRCGSIAGPPRWRTGCLVHRIARRCWRTRLACSRCARVMSLSSTRIFCREVIRAGCIRRVALPTNAHTQRGGFAQSQYDSLATHYFVD